MGCRRGLSLPENVEQAIEELLDYLWDDERKDFSEADDELGECHVFRSLVLIRRWLTSCRSIPPSN